MESPQASCSHKFPVYFFPVRLNSFLKCAALEIFSGDNNIYLYIYMCESSFIIYVLRLCFPRLRVSDGFGLRLIAPLHETLSCATSRFNFKLRKSSSTHSRHAFLPLPLPRFLPPTISKDLQAETQLSAFIRSTCPNHLNLPRLRTSSTASIPKRHFLK